MRHIEIHSPIWKDRSVGIASYKIDQDIEVEITYKDKKGERMFPCRFFMTREKALSYPSKMVKNVVLKIIPISDFQIL